MIVEDQFDSRLCRVSSVKELKELDEFTATVFVLDQSVNLAGEKVNAGQEAHRTVALVFVIARKIWVGAGLGRQVRALVGDGLNPWLLIVRDDRHRFARLVAVGGLLEELNFTVHTKYVRHFLLKLGVAAFEVVADLVRSDLLAIEDFADRTLGQLGQARMPCGRSVLPRMAGQQPRRP